MSPANGADTGNQAEPVHEQNENEDGREEPKSFAHQFAADDSLQEIVKTFHQPFPEILDAAGHWPYSSRGGLRKNNDTRSDNPRHQHRIRDGEFSDLNDR